MKGKRAAAAAPNPETFLALAKEFDACQRTIVPHKKALVTLRSYHDNDAAEFRKSFIACLNRVLVIGKREQSVERLIHFCALYITEAIKRPGTDCDFSTFLLRYVLDRCAAEDKAVRYRCSQLVAETLKQLQEADAVSKLSNALQKEMKEKLVDRTRDKLESVRVEALSGLGVLQIDGSQDVVLNEYMRLLEEDSKKEVRMVALSNMIVNPTTITEIVKRTKDVSDDIRKHAFGIIRDKVSFEQLTAKQRIELLSNGLNDKSELVKAQCVDMIITSWLPAVKGDCIKLIAMFDAEECEDLLELMLRAIVAKVTPPKKFAKKDITPDEALFWRVFVEQHLDRDDEVNGEDDDGPPKDSLIPEFDKLCELIKRNAVVSATTAKEFIVKQLLLLCKSLDMDMRPGKRQLSALLRSLLPSPKLSDSHRQMAMQVLMVIHPDQNEYTQMILEIISEIKDPLEEQSESQQEDEDDSQKWSRIVVITKELLEHMKAQASVDPRIRDLIGNTVVPIVQQKDPQVRDGGIQCLGLFSLLDVSHAKTFLPLFAQSLANDRTTIQMTTLKILFDLLVYYGVDEMKTTAPSGDEVNALEILRNQLMSLSTDEKLRSLIVEGFAKLFFTNTVSDPKLLSRLFVLYFDPAVAATKVRKCLEVFFKSFAYRSHRNQSMIEKAFLDTLRTIIRAPTSTYGPKKANLLEVAQELLELTNPEFVIASPPHGDAAVQQKRKSYHNRLGITIASEILASPHTDIRMLNKVFPMLKINKEDLPSIRELFGLLDKLLAHTHAATDKSHRKAVETLRDSLASLLGASPTKDLPKKSPAKGVTFADGTDKTSKRATNGHSEEEEEEESSAAEKMPVRPEGALRARIPAKRLKTEPSVVDPRGKELASLDDFELEVEETPSKRKPYLGSPGTTPKGKRADAVCGNCSVEYWTLRCEKCGVYLCQGCKEKVHNEKTTRMFKQHKVLVVKNPALARLKAAAPPAAKPAPSPAPPAQIILPATPPQEPSKTSAADAATPPGSIKARKPKRIENSQELVRTSREKQKQPEDDFPPTQPDFTPPAAQPLQKSVAKAAASSPEISVDAGSSRSTRGKRSKPEKSTQKEAEAVPAAVENDVPVSRKRANKYAMSSIYSSTDVAPAASHDDAALLAPVEGVTTPAKNKEKLASGAEEAAASATERRSKRARTAEVKEKEKLREKDERALKRAERDKEKETDKKEKETVKEKQREAKEQELAQKKEEEERKKAEEMRKVEKERKNEASLQPVTADVPAPRFSLTVRRPPSAVDKPRTRSNSLSDEEEQTNEPPRKRGRPPSAPAAASVAIPPPEAPKRKAAGGVRSVIMEAEYAPEVPSTPVSRGHRAAIDDSPSQSHTKVNVCFSGLSSAETLDLTKKVAALGGRVSTAVNKETTHVIVLSLTIRTGKTLTAALLGKWVVAAAWIHESVARKQWLPEETFGRCHKTKDNIAGKRFFITEDFKKEPKYDNALFNQLIVQIGRGKIIHPKPVEIDYYLAAPHEKLEVESGEVLGWNDFMDLIQPKTTEN